jgi:parvulin-like peptidyl-prolyl isomerase
MAQVTASHILVDTQEQAQQLKQQISEGASFADLAQQHSKCPSKANGGSLGTFQQGQMVAPFEAAAFATEPGQVSDPVETQFGWHIIHRTA